MPYYRDEELYDDLYNFEYINNRRKLDKYGYLIRPKHHPRDTNERVRLPAIPAGRNLVNKRTNSRPVMIDRRLQMNKEPDWHNERKKLHAPRQQQKEPIRAETCRPMRRSTTAHVTASAQQTTFGDPHSRQNGITDYEKEYIQLMEGVVDKRVIEKNPKVVEYERKNKIKSGSNILPNHHAQNSQQRLGLPTAQPPEDIFSQRIREYEARNQPRKTSSAYQKQDPPPSVRRGSWI